MKTTAEAAPEFFKRENIAVFVRQGVYSEKEVVARANIMLETYIKTVSIEARTMVKMARRQIFPAVNAYLEELLQVIESKRAVKEDLPSDADMVVARTLSEQNEALMRAAEKLEGDLLALPEGAKEAANAVSDVIIADMATLRVLADSMEALCSSARWPFPTYNEILYSVK